ncbi:M23 family metallopeptidase [Leadbetterella sp. DM7]|uniref:M23 family metallopeptidase n=1 Tax=Leadbetterella sp. DM7 TaxID=3235085 RepID=UPI00349ECDCA
MKKLLLAFTLILPFTSRAQQSFPKGYFIMPINPGQVTSLSGCFGDIRINHFHSGLDVRTGGQEGKRVVAAADGYVSRIRVQNGGYGNVLYITHPNGYTTVYAHLKEFNSELSHYLTSRQYEQKIWEIDVPVEPGRFNYKQGDFVALSGNTGGSAGPHLHFEIRDEKENALDPQQFGFKELRDITPPVIELITLKCMSADARINGRFGSFDFKPVKQGNRYVLPRQVKATGLVGVEVLTYDKAANSPFRLGVNEIELKMNDKREYRYRLDRMAFHSKLDMNIHVDYERLIKNNQKIHKCYVEEANRFDFYESNDHWGLLKVEKAANDVSIRVSDSHGNTTSLAFTLLKDNSEILSEPALPSVTVMNNFLKINTEEDAENLRIITYGGKEITLQTRKSAGGGRTAVYDLKEGFPEEVFMGEKKVSLPVNTAITLQNPRIDMPNLRGDFSETLYDDAYILAEVSDEALVLHEDVIPLKGEAALQWTKTGQVTYPEKQKVYLEGNKKKFIGGEWKDKTIHFRTREFGTYLTLYDFDPPVITPRTVNADALRFAISDKLSGIRKIECYVNGEWVLMDYEYKTGAIWARKRDASQSFAGNLVLKVTDNCNNTQSYETVIP